MQNNKNHKNALNFFLDYPSQSVSERKYRAEIWRIEKISEREKILENYFENRGFLILGGFDASFPR